MSQKTNIEKLSAKRRLQITLAVVYVTVSVALAVIVFVTTGVGEALATLFWGLVFAGVLGSQVGWFRRYKKFQIELAEQKSPEGVDKLIAEYELV